jgi:UDP-glucose 4-epimerase
MKKKYEKILIAGANGLLGRNLVDILSQTHIVFALVKKKTKIQFKLNKNITVLEVNLSNIDTKKLPNKIDVIYYLAQSNKRKNFPEEVDDIIAINILAPNILAKWGIKIGVKKFIYVSSGGVYDNSKKPVKEFANINANKNREFYLNSKLCAEILLKNYSNLFETFIILRPFFIYGIGQKKNMLISRLISNVKNDREININGKDGIKINPIYATDAANAVANVINIKKSMTINIGGNEIISLKALILMIGDETAKQPIISNNKYTKNNLIGDITLMRKNLFKPKIDLKTGVKMTIRSIY